MLVDVLLRALERLGVAPGQVLLVDPVPVGGPHVEADEVDRRALVIVDDVQAGVGGRLRLPFAAGRHQLRRRQRLDQARGRVDPLAVRADVVHAARLVGELPDDHRVAGQLRHQEVDERVVRGDRLLVRVEAAGEMLEAVPVAVRRRRRIRNRARAGPRQVLREAARPLPEVVEHVDRVEAALLDLLREAHHAADARRIVLAHRGLDRRDDPERLAVGTFGRDAGPDHVDARGLDAVEIAPHLIPARPGCRRAPASAPPSS